MVSAHNPISLCSKSFWLTEFFFLGWSEVSDAIYSREELKTMTLTDMPGGDAAVRIGRPWQTNFNKQLANCSGKLSFIEREDETEFRISTGYTCSYQLKLSPTPNLVDVYHQPDVCVSHDDVFMMGTTARDTQVCVSGVLDTTWGETSVSVSRIRIFACPGHHYRDPLAYSNRGKNLLLTTFMLLLIGVNDVLIKTTSHFIRSAAMNWQLVSLPETYYVLEF